MTEKTPDDTRDNKRDAERRDALAKLAVFGAFTAPLVLASLTATTAVAASRGNPPGGGVSGNAGN